MAHSLTYDPAPRTEQQLRAAEAEFMEALTPKTAGGISAATNEDETRTDKATVYKDPTDRPKPGDIDAPWGVDPNRPGDPMPNPLRFSDAYADLYDDTRQGVVDRSLSGAGAAQQVSQKIVAENLAHAASGEFSTHTLQLRPKSKEKLSHSQAQTLSEQLRNVLK